jgi:RNA recognition motif-containing protein
VKDKHNNVSKGFGFILIFVQVEAEAAIFGLNGKELRGRKFTVGEVLPLKKCC